MRCVDEVLYFWVCSCKVRGTRTNRWKNLKNSGSFLLDNLTVVSKRKECVGKKNILGTFIVGNKLLTSFEKIIGRSMFL